DVADGPVSGRGGVPTNAQRARGARAVGAVVKGEKPAHLAVEAVPATPPYRPRGAGIASARSGRSVVKTSTASSNILVIAGASLQPQPPMASPAARTAATIPASSMVLRRPSMGTDRALASSITPASPISTCRSGATSQT